ncbi:Rne/Rng family ribonuclease [Psychrobacter arenosus]|uniref:Rne/Rng family ribonuclease n=1 Tax=Psychrobacter arenosus TaxID=256326 RepID=UPI0019196731|nr:Rne/Rng family ribonuclease [Psychrobacter arenosus]
MSEELLINVSPMESRVAVLDNGVLGEIYIERHHKLGLVGNIYLGTVVRVLPGMQAAFVDIGQSRTAFLHVNDMQRLPRPVASQAKAEQPEIDSANNDYDSSEIAATSDFEDGAISSQSNNETAASVSLEEPLTVDNQPLKHSGKRPITPPSSLRMTPPVVSPKPITPRRSSIPQPPKQDLIQHRLHEGQRILVQVTKDQLGTKGARLTTNITLPSRYLVYLPSSEHIGISQRIDSEEERNRLKTELSSLMQTVNLTGGLIARTAAERVPVDKLEEDIYYLLQLWRTIQARRSEARQNQSSVLLYQELSLPLRSIRDLVHAETEKVVVDNEALYQQIRQFAKEFVPFIYERIVHYTAEPALFDVHRVEEDLRDALKRRVDLKSGGYLIIDQTEAMTTIDVNTGSFVGGRSLEDTVYKTNLEATHAIARQLRLRNLGGIIILDFIDMLEQEHKDDVLTSLQEQLAQDYAKTNITQVSELGLVEMTRKRTRESLEQQLCEPCSTCQGRGFVKTAETVCFEIFREIMRCARTYNAPKKFTVVAHAAVIDLLLSSEADTVADLEYLLGRVITFEVENLYTQEQYDIVLD